MDWNEEEVARCGLDAMSAYKGTETIFIPTEVLVFVMTRAVELVAARGGTMTADQIAEAWTHWPPTREDIYLVRRHIAAQGARVAVLERDLDLARKGFDPGSPAEFNIRALEARLSSLRPLISQVAALSVEMAKVVGEPATTDCPSTEACAVCGAASGFPCNPRVRRHLRECGTPSACFLATLHPCSPTCTHDDAATPGHAERVKERSGAFSAATQAALEVEHDSEHPEWPTRADDDNTAADSDAFDRGAEAMRAACWEAIRIECDKDGIGDMSYIYKRFKAAIEGAAL